MGCGTMKYSIGSRSVRFYELKNGIDDSVLDLSYRIKKFSKRVEFSILERYHNSTEESLSQAKSILPEIAKEILELNCVVKVK